MTLYKYLLYYYYYSIQQFSLENMCTSFRSLIFLLANFMPLSSLDQTPSCINFNYITWDILLFIFYICPCLLQCFLAEDRALPLSLYLQALPALVTAIITHIRNKSMPHSRYKQSQKDLLSLKMFRGFLSQDLQPWSFLELL